MLAAFTSSLTKYRLTKYKGAPVKDEVYKMMLPGVVSTNLNHHILAHYSSHRYNTRYSGRRLALPRYTSGN